MEYSSTHKKDQRTSAIITVIVSLIVLLCIYFYKFTRITPQPEEVVTTMLINFGDHNNGNGAEEPAPEEGSLASKKNRTEASEIKQVSTATTSKSQPKTKIITGNDTKRSVTKTPEKVTAKTQKNSSAKKTETKTSSKASTSKKNTSEKGKADGKGTAAIGNLLRGRGSKKGSQGNGGKTGNAGDPLGGSGNGNSKIGVDRKLIAFIPGTMGRGGIQPSHNCSASGTIQIAYTVDRTGRVISAKRISGIADPCVVKTTVDWVKRYVKAEKGTYSSTGIYSIKF